MAFAAHFFGTSPLEFMSWTTADISYWFHEAHKLHTKLNKPPDGG